MGIDLHDALLTRHNFLDDCFTWGRHYGATPTDFFFVSVACHTLKRVFFMNTFKETKQ